MLIAGLVLNVLILVPVVGFLSADGPGAAAVYGPSTQARTILLCVYAAILLASIALIALHAVAHVWAVPMTLALFAVQIAYKLLTVPLVGIANPVVATNVIVVVVQLAIIATLAARGDLSVG